MAGEARSHWAPDHAVETDRQGQEGRRQGVTCTAVLQGSVSGVTRARVGLFLSNFFYTDLLAVHNVALAVGRGPLAGTDDAAAARAARAVAVGAGGGGGVASSSWCAA